MQELELRQEELGSSEITTIYFGGGTPSVLSSDEIKSFITFLRVNFEWANPIEITLEANAENLTDELLTGWAEAGINRLSIGVQSFQQDVLTWMRRTHSALDALNGIPRAKHKGFDNISIDLIYGLPTHLNMEWEEGIKQAIDLGVQHISSYILTTEPHTLLDKQVRSGEVQIPSDEEVKSQYEILVKQCETAGFDHYEISNFGKPGFYSKHNTSYWNGVPYVGIGPSAHSYDGKRRSWNIRSNAGYVQSIKKGVLPMESEILSKADQFNEYIMTGLRTKKGIDLDIARSRFGQDLKSIYGAFWNEQIQQGLAVEEGAFWKLSNQGLLQADSISAHLFLLQE